MYEALASGLPVITTNHPPMNEVINNNVGYLVDVEYFRCRSDGYYWPLSIVNIDSLISGMKYFITNKEKLAQLKIEARNEAITKWNWLDRKDTILNIFENSNIIVKNPSENLLSETNKLKKILRKVESTYIFSVIYNILKK